MRGIFLMLHLCAGMNHHRDLAKAELIEKEAIPESDWVDTYEVVKVIRSYRKHRFMRS